MQLKQVLLPTYIKTTVAAPNYAHQVVYTNDRDSIEIIFEMIDCESSELEGGTGQIQLLMKDGSFFTGEATINPLAKTASYIMTEEQGNHAGVVQTQVQFILQGKRWASSIHKFEIVPGLETDVPFEFIVEEWRKLTSTKAFLFYLDGELEAETGAMSLIPPYPVEITEIRAKVDTAADGADIIFDFHVDGVSLYTNQENRPTIPPGIDSITALLPDTVTIPAWSKLTLDVDQVGTTTAGENLSVTIQCKLVDYIEGL